MGDPRYYEPREIRSHPGVLHKPLDDRADLYEGEATALIEAGVLQEHMLPPGGSTLSWRPAGRDRTKGESVMYVPGYLIVARGSHTGYRVLLTVSREEQAARREETARRYAEREAAIESARHGRASHAHVTEATAAEDPEAFRDAALAMCRGFQTFITGGSSSGYVIARAQQQELLALACELERVLLSARMVDTRRRKHLTLAWSA